MASDDHYSDEGGSRSRRLVEFVVASARDAPPAHIVEAAKFALIDHVGVTLGGIGENAALGARKLAADWRAPGHARIIAGPRTRAGLAAFVNATAAHALDFDDTHADGSGHISAVVWSTALALASDLKRNEQAAIKAFIAGFEVMARLGGGGTYGVGKALQQRGLHPTSVNGTVGAAAAAASVMQLDRNATAHALGLAATSASGLVASFGTDAKPFHAGRAAWNGIVAAELAANGVTARTDLFETDTGMLPVFIQDGNVTVPEVSFDYWELERNGYKAYPCCRAAHASILAASRLAPKIAGKTIQAIRARVHWSAQFTAGIREPCTPLEAKFSVAYCVAAALQGRALTLQDFEEPVLSDPGIRALSKLVRLEPVKSQPQRQATVEVLLLNGETITGTAEHFLGHPDNSMSGEQLTAKFMSLSTRVLGTGRAATLLNVLRNFESAGSLKETENLCAGEPD